MGKGTWPVQYYYYTKVSLESDKWLHNNDSKLLIELLLRLSCWKSNLIDKVALSDAQTT